MKTVPTSTASQQKCALSRTKTPTNKEELEAVAEAVEPARLRSIIVKLKMNKPNHKMKITMIRVDENSTTTTISLEAVIKSRNTKGDRTSKILIREVQRAILALLVHNLVVKFSKTELAPLKAPLVRSQFTKTGRRSTRSKKRTGTQKAVNTIRLDSTFTRTDRLLTLMAIFLTKMATTNLEATTTKITSTADPL